MTSSPPSITQVTYAGGSLAVYWDSDGQRFVLTVTDTTAGTATTHDAVGFMHQLAIDLFPSHAYTVSIACTDGGTPGPASPAIPIITAVPTVTQVQNTLATVDVAWNAASGYDYVATLQVFGGSSTSNPTSATTTSFQPSGILSGDGNTVSLQLQRSVNGALTSGPPAQYAVITDTPVLASVDYSQGRDLALTWATLTGYTTFKAYLQPSTGDPAIKPVTGQTVTFPGTLGSDGYQTYVCACSADGVSIGPPSTSYTPIIVAPTMRHVVNTGAGLRLAWDVLPPHRLYRAEKHDADGTVTRSVARTDCTFDGALSGGGITCAVSAMSHDRVSIGPAFPRYTAIVGQPVWQTIDYDAGTIALTWSAVTEPGVSGYLVEIGGLASDGYPVGNITTMTVSAGLTALQVYPATVRATDGIVQGPPSYALAPLTAAPLAPRLGFNGSKLQLDWRPSGEDGVTGYATDLLAAGTSKEQHTPAASPQLFDSGLDLGTVFTSRVRATSAKRNGPWSALATGPYKTVMTFAFDSQARLSGISWTGGTSQSFAFDGAGNLLSSRIAMPTRAARE